jgi:hypothetical protein
MSVSEKYKKNLKKPYKSIKYDDKEKNEAYKYKVADLVLLNIKYLTM